MLAAARAHVIGIPPGAHDYQTNLATPGLCVNPSCAAHGSSIVFVPAELLPSGWRALACAAPVYYGAACVPFHMRSDHAVRFFWVLIRSTCAP